MTITKCSSEFLNLGTLEAREISAAPFNNLA